MINDDGTTECEHILTIKSNESIATKSESKSIKYTIIGVITCLGTLLLAFYFKDSILNIFVYLDTIESDNQFMVNFIIFLLFIACSLPILWGYSLCILIISYLHDFIYGFILTILFSSIGMSISFLMCRYLFYNFNCTNRYKNSRINNNIYFNVFVNCIEGGNGYKIILLSRIIPLPFGLANLMYSMTKINFINYIISSILGLIPTQLLTCYIGSTLKSISDIISYSKSKNAMNAYYIFGIQLIISFVLMYYLVKMAKFEFDKRLNNTINNENNQSSSQQQILLNSTIVINSNEMVN
jgi:protein maelstrom